ncbi:MAG: nucleoside triphosphate pyrophosphohydrolase [Pseudanabaenaceae cyanobacterium SKYGB_i_bin29]|nr:nucleoside triphosphate pyrophosphohydrolase [Pseudanabaenaceae cyanobacterium SKYG29]MDW8420371.1 nucleoside triphosphate pyrophosphohydrolase [Pseudanabaenaceae cyanobacterium SKYGB_i_bin29]
MDTTRPGIGTDVTLAALGELITIVAQLRHPQTGCPWDLAQTPQTLMPYIVEEAYETVDALRSGDSRAICEELGDLLLQVVLQAQIAQERGEFSLTDVARGISEKLVRRHPHVFGNLQVNNTAEVTANWEKIKDEENQHPPLSEKLKKYQRSLPPLEATMKISGKVAALGFDWENIEGVWAKYAEEMEEFRHALATENPDRQSEELGDVLFTLLQIARWYKLDPTAALMGTNQRFIDRWCLLEKQAPKPLQECTLAELEQLWQNAKEQLRQKNG